MLAHELVHLDLGHTAAQPPEVERLVRLEAARRLISLAALLDAMRWTLDPHELAEELWVIPVVLSDRMAGLTLGEVAAVAVAIAHHSHALDGEEDCRGQGV